MIITFRSKAAGDVIQFGEVAKRLLGIMGKDPEATQGIITVEQLPEAIARLRAAVEAERAEMAAKPRRAEDDEEEEQERRGGPRAISLAQRAAPMFELMEYALRYQHPVTWGV